MIIILGDYNREKKKIIIVILSKQTYLNTNIYINEKLSVPKFDIIEYEVQRICLDLHSHNIKNINIKFLSKDLELIEHISKLNLTSTLENVDVVNCDSTYGIEKNLWNKISNAKSHTIIHCGDQIYNDKLFKNYHKNIKMDEEGLDLLHNDIFDAYYTQFSRYKRVLKNNLNLMIPDDHEVVDNTYNDKYANDKTFLKIKKVFVDFYTKIQLGLKISDEKIYYLENKKNSTIYVLNYEETYDEKILSENGFYSKIKPYQNIVLISRKSLLSSKISFLNRIVYSMDKYEMNQIDFLLKIAIKTNKKIFVLCGDDHTYKKSIIRGSDGKTLCTIITCGPINTVPELFKNEIILNTKLPNLSIENKHYLLVNSFVQIKGSDKKINIKKIIHKSDPITTIFDNVITAIQFL